MQQIMWQDRTAGIRWPQNAFQAFALTVVTMGCIGITDEAQAKSGKLGVYTGTVAVSGTIELKGSASFIFWRGSS